MDVDVENIFIQIPNFIFVKNLKSQFTGCNSNFAYAAGLTRPKEIIGKTDYDMPWGDSHAGLYRQGDMEVLENSAKTNFFETQLKSNGDIVIIQISKAPLFDQKKQKIGVIGSYMEYTPDQYRGNFNPYHFTRREADILRLIIRGKTAKETATTFCLSTRTVENYLATIKEKVGVRSKSALIEKLLETDFR